MNNKKYEGFVTRPILANAGVGLKPQHFEQILSEAPLVSWFEIHPENYLVEGGPMLHYLSKIRESYPLSFHSVGMSLGSADGIKEEHLVKIKKLSERFEPALISDHLSWSQWGDLALNDLLPIPYTREALTILSVNIDKAQAILGRTIAIENPSSYFNLNKQNSASEMDECEFIVNLAKISGASILLDVNNVYVSACNNGWSAEEYILGIPPELVSEIHLAGHSLQETEFGDVRIDDHGSSVPEEVWSLYEMTLACIGKRPSLIEWDTNVPEWHVLANEARRADLLMSGLSDV